MNNDKCELCRYWGFRNMYERGVGICHRYPPALVATDEYRASWPRTGGDEVCGEFGARTNVNAHSKKPEVAP